MTPVRKAVIAIPLAQLNQLAATNPKMAAAAMLQLQQQHLLGQPSTSSPLPPPALSPQLPTISMPNQSINQANFPSSQMHSSVSSNNFSNSNSNKLNPNRYQQLLGIIDEMGKDIRTTYSSNKNSIERLKRSIASARILVKDCQLECERNTKN